MASNAAAIVRQKTCESCGEKEREREQLSRQLNQPNKGAEEHLESQTPLFENAFFSAISRYSTHFTCGDRVV
jgi:hypothetical protein